MCTKNQSVRVLPFTISSTHLSWTPSRLVYNHPYFFQSIIHWFHLLVQLLYALCVRSRFKHSALEWHFREFSILSSLFFFSILSSNCLCCICTYVYIYTHPHWWRMIECMWWWLAHCCYSFCLSHWSSRFDKHCQGWRHTHIHTHNLMSGIPIWNVGKCRLSSITVSLPFSQSLIHFPLIPCTSIQPIIFFFSALLSATQPSLYSSKSLFKSLCSFKPL